MEEASFLVDYQDFLAVVQALRNRFYCVQVSHLFRWDIVDDAPGKLPWCRLNTSNTTSIIFRVEIELNFKIR